MGNLTNPILITTFYSTFEPTFNRNLVNPAQLTVGFKSTTFRFQCNAFSHWTTLPKMTNRDWISEEKISWSRIKFFIPFPSSWKSIHMISILFKRTKKIVSKKKQKLKAKVNVLKRKQEKIWANFAKLPPCSKFHEHVRKDVTEVDALWLKVVNLTPVLTANWATLPSCGCQGIYIRLKSYS